MQRSLYTYGLAARGKVRSHRMLRVALRQHRTNQTHWTRCRPNGT